MAIKSAPSRLTWSTASRRYSRVSQVPRWKVADLGYAVPVEFPRQTGNSNWDLVCIQPILFIRSVEELADAECFDSDRVMDCGAQEPDE